MDEKKLLSDAFEASRAHLRKVAYRMLGSTTEADDAVQEAWLRLSRSDTGDVENLRGWLTTVVARICLDMLRSRKSRSEEPIGDGEPAAAVAEGDAPDPERDAVLADSVGVALLVVLEKLPPAERVAFVLHDMFDLSFDEIAAIIDRSSAATRQLASRARRRVQGADAALDADQTRRRQVIEAFFAASRGGDFAALLAVLDPDVIVRADGTAVQFGAAPEVRGADAVANTFKGRAAAAKLVLVDGVVGLMWAPGGKPRVVFDFAIADGKVKAIDLIGDPERIGQFDLVLLGG